jgi:hypothetical protein
MAEQEPLRHRGDSLETFSGERPFDLSATAWLIGQGTRYLNTSDKEGELAYKRVGELLRDKKDSVETLIGLIRRVPSADVSLRWSLLYMLGDIGDPTAAAFLVDCSIGRLPEELKDRGCEGPRDGEILVRTMAVEALQRIATRHPNVAEHVLKIISKPPARSILIEAVKAATALGLKDKVAEILPKEDHWILDIRRARADELHAEPERDDTAAQGFAPPKSGSLSTSPYVKCQCE